MLFPPYPGARVLVSTFWLTSINPTTRLSLAPFVLATPAVLTATLYPVTRMNCLSCDRVIDPSEVAEPLWVNAAFCPAVLLTVVGKSVVESGEDWFAVVVLYSRRW